MDFNYLTLGCDCSPASALKNLNLRNFALPFDWVVSNIHILSYCFKTNFEHFHTNLVFNHNRTRLIDYYGFQFPHDYPLSNVDIVENNIGEGVFAEEKNKYISEDWNKYYTIVLDKYKRRIERFKSIIADKKPIIVLCRYSTRDVLLLHQLFIYHYKLTNIYFCNSSNEMFENNHIINIYTEKNNIWNDVTIWEEGIQRIIKKIIN
jgi:hypothetical protein